MKIDNICKICKNNDSVTPCIVYCTIVRNYLHVPKQDCDNFKQRKNKEKCNEHKNS